MKQSYGSKTAIYGVISKNMVNSGWKTHPEPLFQNIPACSPRDLVIRLWTLLFSSSEYNYDLVRLIDNKEFTAKQIKTILIDEKAMTLKDIEAIQQEDIPRTPFYNIRMKMDAGSFGISILPSHNPAPLLLSNIGTSQKCVIWSTTFLDPHSIADEKSYQFLCPDTMTYQDFLIHFCKFGLKLKLACQIEYELFIFINPVVFGKALCVPLQPNSNSITFYFSRLLYCHSTKDIVSH
jgi:hypothetical protein